MPMGSMDARAGGPTDRELRPVGFSSIRVVYATTCRCALLALAALCGVALALPARAARASGSIFVFEEADGTLHFSDTPHHAGYRLHHLTQRSAAAAREARQRAFIDRFDALIVRASRAHNVSPGLVKAVIHVESKFNPNAVSRKGASGLMQLMPATAGELGVLDPFNPWENIEAGTRYLNELVQRFDGDLRLGLAAYHAGPARVVKHGGVPPYRTTRQYIDQVLKLYRRYHADFR